MLRHHCLLPLAAAVLLAVPAHALDGAHVRWWDLGHRLVARLAEPLLTAEARAAARDLLGGQSLADASVWADNIRHYRRDTDKLHFVNIPLAATSYDSARDCPRGECIIAAIERDRRILADTAASADERAEALRFLIHFIGDLHQPLHVADDVDRGGNQRRVVFLGRPTDLHKVWDGELVEAFGMTGDQYLAYLRARMKTMDLRSLERGTPADWAMEEHRAAAEYAYKLPRDGRLGRAYVQAGRTVIDHALLAAGVRLAMVLNQALAGYRVAAPAMAADTVAGPPGTVTDREALAHVGRTVTVVGTVAEVSRSRKGTVYVNFGARFPRQTFTAVALAPAPAWTAGLDTLEGRRIGVRGRIVRYRGRVEIVLKGADQLVAAQPAEAP
jgi:hypothetical protein